MKNVKRLMTSVLIGLFSMSIIGCNMIEKTPEAIAKMTVAKVNGKKITRGELDANPQTQIFMKQVEEKYGESYDKIEDAKQTIISAKKQVLDSMIMEEVLYAEADKRGIIPKEDDLDKEVNKLFEEEKSSYKDEKEFNEQLEKQGYTEEIKKENLRKQVIVGKLYDDIVKDIKVTDEEAKKHYEENKYSFPVDAENPSKIDAAHILVKTEEEAKKVKERLDKGEDFAALAKELSQDPGSKDNGGVYEGINFDGTWNGSRFDPTFVKTAIALNEGEVAEPVQTQFGYHIIKCIKKTETPVKSYDEVKEQIKVYLENEKKYKEIMTKVSELKNSADSKIYEENLI